MRSCSIFVAAFAATLLPVLAQAGAYPPADQKRLPLVLRNHGIFWAGGRVVNRTQTGTESAGDLKNIPYNQQQVLAGQAYVEYFIPQRLRNGRRTLPVVMIPGGGLTGVHFLTTPDGREGWAHHFIRRGYPVYIIDVPGRGRAGFVPDRFNDVRGGSRAEYTTGAADVGQLGLARVEHRSAAGADTQAWSERSKLYRQRCARPQQSAGLL
jgi:pimeloyl-ACP methyl ester carboxylesterase